jgi:hypothetical protein
MVFSGTAVPASGSAGLSTGAIVGIAVGGATTLVIAVVLFWLWRRRQVQEKPGYVDGVFDGPSGDLQNVHTCLTKTDLLALESTSFIENSRIGV